MRHKCGRTAFRGFQGLHGKLQTCPLPVLQFLTNKRSNGKIVTVVVGRHLKKEFDVHAKLLSSSEYFKNALKPPWKESNGYIAIDHVTWEIFEIYLQWVYTRKTLLPDDEDTNELFTMLHHAYVLGDYLQDVSFKNSIIEEAVSVATAIFSEEMPHHLADLVYGDTTESSPWRRLYVDLFLWGVDGNGGTPGEDWYDMKVSPKKFFVDLLFRRRPEGYECGWLHAADYLE